MIPEYFSGIFDLRGQFYPLLILEKISITPSTAKETSIIILDLENLKLGAIVDFINRITSIDPSKLSGSPDINSDISQDFISGVHRGGDHLTLLLDIEKILSSKDVQIINS